MGGIGVKTGITGLTATITGGCGTIDGGGGAGFGGIIGGIWVEKYFEALKYWNILAASLVASEKKKIILSSINVSFSPEAASVAASEAASEEMGK